MKPTVLAAARWLSVSEAAAILSMSAEALRKTIERRAMKAPDGGVEAELDGVRARKFGRLWRVTFSERWTAVEATTAARART